jgi:hypothetical protein
VAVQSLPSFDALIIAENNYLDQLIGHMYHPNLPNASYVSHDLTTIVDAH